MGDIPRGAAGMAVAAAGMVVLASCGGPTPGASWQACQDASDAMQRLNPTLEEHGRDDASGDDVARVLEETQARMEDVAEQARADDVSSEAEGMAEYLGELSDGYADRDDEAISQARAPFRQHVDRFVEACQAAWDRQL